MLNLRNTSHFVYDGLFSLNRISFFCLSNEKVSEKTDIPYNGDLANYDALYAWASDVCTLTIREITFENAEV